MWLLFDPFHLFEEKYEKIHKTPERIIFGANQCGYYLTCVTCSTKNIISIKSGLISEIAISPLTVVFVNFLQRIAMNCTM